MIHLFISKAKILLVKAIPYLLIGILGVGFFNEWRASLRPDNEWKTITNVEYGFSVDYPTKWKAKAYGKQGYRGADDLKLLISPSNSLGFGVFKISVHRLVYPNPTLDYAVAWGDRRIEQINQNYLRRGVAGCEKLEEWPDVIHNQDVIRRRYDCGITSNEDVYITRANDILIITLQGEKGKLGQYQEDFDTIVDSFRLVD